MASSANGPQDLNYLLNKLQDWRAEVTGEDLKKREELKNDEFLTIEKKIREEMDSVGKLQRERNEEAEKEDHSAATVLRKTKKLGEMFKTIEADIESMGKIVERNRKKFGDAQSNKRLKIQSNYKEMLKVLREREKESEEDNGMKKRLNKKKRKSVDWNVDDNELNEGHDLEEGLDDDENAALARWQETDKKIDDLAGRIADALDEVENGLDTMREKIKDNRDAAGKLHENVDKLNKKFDTTNTKLKKILLQLRSPHRFCVDVARVIVFLVMLGIMFKIISN